jgi:hypothetical protein
MNSNKGKHFIEKLLQKNNVILQKTSGDDNWYFSPFVKKVTPHLIKLNFWYDFRELIGGKYADYLMFKLTFTFRKH